MSDRVRLKAKELGLYSALWDCDIIRFVLSRRVIPSDLFLNELSRSEIMTV